jgi:hypothetical protein
MMHNSIIHEHEGKLVIIYTIRGTFEGVLESKNSGLLMALKPQDEWTAKHYGATHIDTASVVAIKEIKPQSDSKDSGEDDCCDQDSPKARFKKSEQSADEAKPRVLPGDTLAIIDIYYAKDTK